MSGRLGTIEKSISYVMETQDSFDNCVKIIENQIQSSKDTQNQITILENKIDSMEQQARLYNIEIANLPERRNEDLLGIIENIGFVIKHPINRSDIVSAHRVPHFDKKSPSPKNLIVRFTTKIMRDNFLAAARANKNLKSDRLSINGTPHNVYVNEHLTVKNKQLFRQCREKANNCNYKYVWIKRGTVLVRQSDNSPIFAVHNDLDLKKIKP